MTSSRAQSPTPTDDRPRLVTCHRTWPNTNHRRQQVDSPRRPETKTNKDKNKDGNKDGSKYTSAHDCLIVCHVSSGCRELGEPLHNLLNSVEEILLCANLQRQNEPTSGWSWVGWGGVGRVRRGGFLDATHTQHNHATHATPPQPHNTAQPRNTRTATQNSNVHNTAQPKPQRRRNATRCNAPCAWHGWRTCQPRCTHS
jgi:hypothetical protein